MTTAERISQAKFERIVELSGYDQDIVAEFLYADWDNQDEHQEWLESASPQEIADWLIAVGPE